MKLKPASDRGFLRGDFLDEMGLKCSIQKSSLATEDCIWLGISSNRMHLTVDMVKDLLPALQWFVDTGELPKFTDEAKTSEELIAVGKARAFKGLYFYSKGLITIGRLGEVLGQSPPVVRQAIVKAADKMRGTKRKKKA